MVMSGIFECGLLEEEILGVVPFVRKVQPIPPSGVDKVTVICVS